MISLLCSSIACYHDNATIHGKSQAKILILHLSPQPENDQLCVASANRESICKVQYLDSTGDVQNITADYIYSNIAENKIIFDLSDNPELYDLISKQSLLSYVALIVGSLESSGAIQTVKHTQMNSTNCWSDLVFLYNRTKGYEFLQLDGTPLDCKIESPAIQFQYSFENQWISININGINQPGFYYKGNVFDNSQTFHYKQTISDLIDTRDIKNFKNLFTQFQNNRSIKVRMYVSTRDGPLEQIILAEPQFLLSYSSQCYDQLQPQGYASPYQLLAFSKSQLFENAKGCNQKTEKVSSQMIVNSKIFNFSSDMENNTILEFKKRVGFIVHLDNPIPNFQLIKSGILVSYITFYDENNNILNEESILLELRLTCIQSLQTYFQQDQLCLQIQKINSTQCSMIEQVEFIYVLGLQLGDFTKRQIAFTFQMNYNMDGTKQCTSKYSYCDYSPNIPGTVKQKTKYYQQSIANKTQTFNFLQGQNEFVFSSLVLLTDLSQIYFYMGVFIVFVIICSTTGILMYCITYHRK